MADPETSSLLTDGGGVPVPQHWDPDAAAYEARTGASGASDVRIEDGANVALGARADAEANDLTAPQTLIALVKRLITTVEDFNAQNTTTARAARDDAVRALLRVYEVSDQMVETSVSQRTSDSITLSWQAVDFDVHHYEVYRSDDGGATYAYDGSTTKTTYTSTGLSGEYQFLTLAVKPAPVTSDYTLKQATQDYIDRVESEGGAVEDPIVTDEIIRTLDA